MSQNTNPRKRRVESMISYIESTEERGGAQIEEIKRYMLRNFGLRFETTIKYIKECTIVGFISEHLGKWKTTRVWKKLLENNGG